MKLDGFDKIIDTVLDFLYRVGCEITDDIKDLEFYKSYPETIKSLKRLTSENYHGELVLEEFAEDIAHVLLYVPGDVLIPRQIKNETESQVIDWMLESIKEHSERHLELRDFSILPSRKEFEFFMMEKENDRQGV